MKITKLDVFLVAPRWVFVKLSTDEGISGVGEALGDKADVIAAALRALEGYLIGRDPRLIEHHWQSMYRGAFWRGGPILNAAISGVEQAMWDILGKSLGVPVYALLGGKCREKIRFYRHVGGETEGDLIRSGESAVKEGFTAVKFSPFGPTKAVDSLRAVKDAGSKMRSLRNALGDGVDIMVDMHGRLSPAMAIVMAEELAPHHPFFLEEPCLPENVDAMVDVARKVKIPIATGERLFTKFGFREVLEKRAAAVLQPDLSVCGGILEGKKIAAMAEAYYVALAPHNPYGPVLTAASIQLDACAPNFLIQEFVSLGEGVLKEPFEMKGGYVEVPTKPGLGIELNEEAIARRPYEGREVPMWYHEDGSLADW
ncbi:MAG: galactonate dehydratase [bacterium]